MARPSLPDPPFGHALVAVCAECSGRQPKPKEVRSALRAGLKAAGARKAVRVVESSCLDVCPKRAVAVAVARVAERGGVTCHVVTSSGDLERLVESVCDEAAGRA